MSILVDNDVYAFMVNTTNSKDSMFAKIIFDNDDFLVEEVNDALIMKRIMEIIQNNDG